MKSRSGYKKVHDLSSQTFLAVTGSNQKVVFNKCYVTDRNCNIMKAYQYRKSFNSATLKSSLHL